MSLFSFYGSERNLNRKGHGHVQTGPTEAARYGNVGENGQGNVQGGQEVTQGLISTETYKRGHRSAKHS